MNRAQEAALKEPTTRFTKVYPKGWHRLTALLRESPMAARVWTFLVENAGHDNALVCSSDVLAEGTGVSVRTVFRAIGYLERVGALVIVKIGPGANCYVLDPAETWKTYEEYRHYCAFNAKTLASKKANPHLKRRLTHMIEKQDAAREPELLPVPD